MRFFFSESSKPETTEHCFVETPHSKFPHTTPKLPSFKWFLPACRSPNDPRTNRPELLVENSRLQSYAPDPATPTVAAPAPMYLAAWSMSCRDADVWNWRICNTKCVRPIKYTRITTGPEGKDNHALPAIQLDCEYSLALQRVEVATLLRPDLHSGHLCAFCALNFTVQTVCTCKVRHHCKFFVCKYQRGVKCKSLIIGGRFVSLWIFKMSL